MEEEAYEKIEEKAPKDEAEIQVGGEISLDLRGFIIANFGAFVGSSHLSTVLSVSVCKPFFSLYLGLSSRC